MYIYEEMVDVLYSKFPELIEKYSNEIEYYRELYREYGDNEAAAYSHYENIFNGFIENALSNEPEGSSLLKRIFTFFEEMANSEDGGVRNLLQVALLESIWSIGYPAYKRANTLMLPQTRNLSLELIRYLNEPQPHSKDLL